MPGPGFARQQEQERRGVTPPGPLAGNVGQRLGGATGPRGNAAAQDALRARIGAGTDTNQVGTQDATAQTTGQTPAGSATDRQINEEALARVATAAVAVAPADLRTYAESAIPGILRQSAASGVTNLNQVAYVLATTEHESKFGRPAFDRSESLVEDRNPFSRRRNGTYSAENHVSGGVNSAKTEDELETKYWDSAYGGRLGNARGTEDARNFRGRGYVQLTGRSNYEGMTRHLNSIGFSYQIDGQAYGGQGNPAIDLAAHPDHVNRVPELAARIMVDGMKNGSFTGRSMGDYINDSGTNFTNARAVVNGDTSTNGASVGKIARRYAPALSGWASVFQVDKPSAAS